MSFVTFAKVLIETGNALDLNRDHYDREIQKRANESFESGSAAQKYTRFITETADGATLFEAYKRAPVAPAPEPAPQGMKASQLGEASEKMNQMAAKLAADKEISFQQAYARILMRPENKELAARVKAEEADLRARRTEQMAPITGAVSQFSS